MSYPKPDIPLPADPEPTKRFGNAVKLRSDVIATLTKARNWKHGAELGAGDGRNAERILIQCPGLHLITVDLWAPQPENTGPETWGNWDHTAHETKARARLKRFGDRVTIIKALTAGAANAVPDGALDFVFIDADHSEQGVRIDIKTWRPKIRPGGILLGHDISWPGVKAAVEDLCPGYWIGPDSVWGVDV